MFHAFFDKLNLFTGNSATFKWTKFERYFVAVVVDDDVAREYDWPQK